MNRQQLIEQIEAYVPENVQEAEDRRIILKHLREEEDIFLRSNENAHMTASAWVTDRERKKVLMVRHNLYHSWSWLGGHADGETDLLAVSQKEVREESGLMSLVPVTEQIISLEILAVAGHVKRGRYVPSHLHLNLTYLLEADASEPLRVKEDENSGVCWFSPEEAVLASEEPWFRERIYPKLNAKLLRFSRS